MTRVVVSRYSKILFVLYFCCYVAIAKLFYVEKFSEFPLSCNLNPKAPQLFGNGLLCSSSALFAMSPNFELVVYEVEVPVVVRLGLESGRGRLSAVSQRGVIFINF